MKAERPASDAAGGVARRPDRRADGVDRRAQFERLGEKLGGDGRGRADRPVRSQSASSAGSDFACSSQSATFSASRRWF